MNHSHTHDSRTPEAEAQASTLPIGRAGRLSSGRRDARVRYAALVHSELAARGISSETAGERSGVSATVLREQRAGVRGIHLCQLAAFGAPVERAVLEARLRQLDAARTASKLPPVTRALRCSACIGEVAKQTADALADGVLDERERKCLCQCVHVAQHELELFADDLREKGE